MDRIVGKTFVTWVCYALMLASCSYVCADVSMRVIGTDGSRLEQAGIGQPFVLEVIATDMNRSMQAPSIAGVETLYVRRTGFSMSTINGKSTVKYTYQVRIDTPGTFTIGPAVVAGKGFKFVSNKLTITVDEQTIVSAKKAKTKKAGYAFARLSCDKKKVFVGEKLICRLRFYYTDDSISLNNLIEQKLAGFSRKDIKGPRTGVKDIDGKLYKYVAWYWDLYPTDHGTHVIPAYGIDFEQHEERDNFWGGLGRFLGPRAERKRVYSNGLQIEAEPLPPCDKKVSAIGTRLSAKAFVKPAVAKKGEGMVLTIELEGDGDMQAIEVPQLQGIPDELRYYDSRQTVIEAKKPGQLAKKRFEYILQGLACGSWEIPKQSFVYFDVKSRSSYPQPCLHCVIFA